MQCPYCRQPIERKIEFIPMAARHQEIVQAILKAGPAGLDKDEFEKRFFKPGRSPITLRTTMNRLNSKIRPLRLTMRGGRVRINPD